jgi:DNA processing protein
LNAYGSAAAAVADAQMWHLRGVAGKGQVRRFLSGDWKPAAEKELQECRRAGMQVLCLSDPGFPELLKNISDPPLYLYVHGDLSLLDNPAVAVVGARRCTRYSTEVARKLGSDLAMAGITVVSGLADGIDRYAHLGSIDRPGRSVAVLGTGLDLIYPARNRDLWERMSEQGLIVTEFPPGTRPDGPNFPHRNRIISGLSLGVVVVQAAVKSGTLITARLAMEQGREVLVVPGPVDGPGYEGSHQLVRDGAALVRGGEDIILELASILESRYPHLGGGITGSAVIPRNEDRVAAMELSGEERQVVDRLLRAGKQQIETLGIALDWDASRLSRVLLMLELKGVVRQLPGMIYEMAEPG